MLNFGGVIAAFRYADNVGFQDQQNFGAYNLHFHCCLVSFTPASHQSVAKLGVGFSSEVAAHSFLMLDFHQLATTSFAPHARVIRAIRVLLCEFSL